MHLEASTILYALAGGGLIGLAAGGLYLTTGRIAGISGIFGDSFLRTPGLWRWMFVAGLVLAGFGTRWFHVPLPPSIDSPVSLLVIAGLLVGFGTRISNGCTSGHGVCGLARLSARSLVAVLVFMATAGLTVFITRHLLGA